MSQTEKRDHTTRNATLVVLLFVLLAVAAILGMQRYPKYWHFAQKTSNSFWVTEEQAAANPFQNGSITILEPDAEQEGAAVHLFAAFGHGSRSSFGYELTLPEGQLANQYFFKEKVLVLANGEEIPNNGSSGAFSVQYPNKMQ